MSDGPLITNINTLVPDLRIAANQSSNIQPSRSENLPPPVRPEAIQIIPGLPDRFSNNTYQLQVGAYSTQNMASRAADYIRASGFNVNVDFSDTVYRVMVIGIPSIDVYSASIRLGALGFGQIWVRE
jgi:cell division protein FtsN